MFLEYKAVMENKCCFRVVFSPILVSFYIIYFQIIYLTYIWVPTLQDGVLWQYHNRRGTCSHGAYIVSVLRFGALIVRGCVFGFAMMCLHYISSFPWWWNQTVPPTSFISLMKWDWIFLDIYYLPIIWNQLNFLQSFRLNHSRWF